MKPIARFSFCLCCFFIITVALTPLMPVSHAQTGATYPIVDTGQNQCYNASGAEITCPAEDAAFYGQDAQHSGNPASYTDNGNGTVTDNVTGLVWQQSPDTDGDNDIDADDKLTYPAAQTYCDNLTLGNNSDWRLPDIKQLYSLINFNGTDISGYSGANPSGFTPFIDTTYFDFAYGDTSAGERLIDSQYASSTLYVANTANDGGSTLFGVNLADGRIKGYGLKIAGTDKTFLVMCVRGSASYGVNSFTDNGDSTITDNATGLMWGQADSAEALNWAEALAWVAQKNSENYLGYDDWRLPNAKELQSLVDYTRSPDTTNSAAIDPLFNASTITNNAGQADYPFYWSSTTHRKWTDVNDQGVYVAFGRAMGYLDNIWQDVHGAGAQRSDPKSGNPADYPTGHGPQGDVVRIYNYVRPVRDTDIQAPALENYLYMPIIINNGS
ncbi:MAG: DUF1566 domain-containing protein [Anaerolineaceae bacterium]|nr:DUF1566 domain-containing protein [Anaerolineaceae bacterium]MCB9099627.1 DUF1566 domain-containing protein [Anaerolineales bacterium]